MNSEKTTTTISNVTNCLDAFSTTNVVASTMVKAITTIMNRDGHTAKNLRKKAQDNPSINT